MADWTEIENDIIIADYFEMLQLELRGIKYNKTKHRNNLKPHLNNRDKAIEFKHQNISAVLVKYGLPYISGYKPYPKLQGLLEKKVLLYLEKIPKIEKDFNDFANQKIEINIPKVEYNNWIEAPPKEKKILKEPAVIYRSPIKRNYLELEQKNQSIGMAGEQLALNYERWRLNNLGLSNLANEVRWISKEEGDGAGFDILSKDKNGKDIFIEVKTTTLGKETPIFFSKRENDFSNQKKTSFNLYRIFDLKDQPKMFSLNGRFQDICITEIFSFKGFF